jgi:hypothetical protein
MLFSYLKGTGANQLQLSVSVFIQQFKKTTILMKGKSRDHRDTMMAEVFHSDLLNRSMIIIDHGEDFFFTIATVNWLRVRCRLLTSAEVQSVFYFSKAHTKKKVMIVDIIPKKTAENYNNRKKRKDIKKKEQRGGDCTNSENCVFYPLL